MFFTFSLLTFWTRPSNFVMSLQGNHGNYWVWFLIPPCAPLRSSLGAKKPAVGRVTNFSSQLYNYILIFLNILDDIDGWFRLGWSYQDRSSHGSNPVRYILCVGWCGLYEPVHCLVVRHFRACLRTGAGKCGDAAGENGHLIGREVEEREEIEVWSLFAERMLSWGKVWRGIENTKKIHLNDTEI